MFLILSQRLRCLASFSQSLQPYARPLAGVCSSSLVDTGSVGNLPDYADIARQLGILWCAVTDEDKPPGGQVNPMTEKVRQRVDAKRGANDSAAMWPGSLESCLGGPAGKKATPEWQAANTDPKPLAQMQQDHPDFMTACNAVLGWISQ